MKNLLALILIMSPSLSMATEWTCTNNEMEITCSAEKCNASDEFTPMRINFDNKGNMSICAYSGCWEGIGKAFISGNYTFVAGRRLKFTSSKKIDGMQSDFLIAIDNNDKVAVLQGHGYAMPITCKTIAQNNN